MILLTPSAGNSQDPLYNSKSLHGAANDIDPYTLVLWRVLPGKREEFLNTWSELIEQLRQLEHPPLRGSLVESLVDDHLFYSIAAWDLLRDIPAMRNDARCRSLVVRLQALCDLSAGGTYSCVMCLEGEALSELPPDRQN